MTVFSNDGNGSCSSCSSDGDDDKMMLEAKEEGGLTGAEQRSGTTPPLRPSTSTASTITTTSNLTTPSNPPSPIRVGFVSRFFYNHAIGVLSEGIIQKLPRPNYQVYVFMIEPDHAEDEVSLRIRAAADKVSILLLLLVVLLLLLPVLTPRPYHSCLSFQAA